MGRMEWEDLGDQIQGIINKAVRDSNYSSLNEMVSDLISQALGGSPSQGKGYQKDFHPEHNARAYETHNSHAYQAPPFGRGQGFGSQPVPHLYAATTSPRLKATGMTILGGILALEGLGSFLGRLIRIASGLGWTVSGFGTGFVLLLGGVGAYLLHQGVTQLGRIKRFGIYRRALGNKSYADLKQFAVLVNKPVSFVKKDVKEMIQAGWFVQGHLDEDETTLMISDEIYRQYVDTMSLRKEQRAQEAQQKLREEKTAQEKARKEAVSRQVQEVLDKGNSYIRQLHECNDAIPGDEMSQKISRMELVVNKIFERAKTHPEVIPDLKKLMNYYLPTAIKLLTAYAEMENQPVQGENIKNAKKEIEETIDTLNLAFEKLLDSIFQDTAWDISSDISVLNTMLAQEGLKEDDFSMGSPSGHKGFGTMGSQPQGQVQAMTLNSTEEKGMTL